MTTAPLAWWDARQYVRDVTTRNHALGDVLRVLWLAVLTKCLEYAPVGYRLIKRLRESMHRWLTGREVPEFAGRIRAADPTPTDRLGLRPGERVRIKAKAEIEHTLNENKKNRGLWFDTEMVPFCGRVATVRREVTRIIDERTGEMRFVKEPCIILDGTACPGHYSENRLLCPRALPPFWRELWLERLEDPPP